MASRRNLSLAAALVALLGVVALASRGHSPAGSTSTGVGSDVLWEAALIALLVAFILCLPVAIWVVVSTRPDLPPSRAEKRRRRIRNIAIFVGVLVTMAVVLRYWHEHRLHPKSNVAQVRAAQASAPRKQGNPGKPIPFDWLPAIVVLSVAGAGAVAVGYVLFRNPKRRPLSQAQLAARLTLVLDESLDDLVAETDARRAVIATYARMELTLERAGLPREAAEAPLEYLARVLRDLLRTSADAVSRLTLLFERAKFSHHDVDRTMKDEAIDALVAVRDELRAAAAT